MVSYYFYVLFLRTISPKFMEKRGRSIATKTLKAFYGKIRQATRRHQGDKRVAEVIMTLNPILRGWGNYHRDGQNVGMERPRVVK